MERGINVNDCGMECGMEVMWVLIQAKVLIDYWEGSYTF